MKKVIAVRCFKLFAVLAAVHFGSQGYIAAKQAIFGQVAEATEQVVAYSAHTLGFVRPAPPMERHTAEMLAEKEALIAGVNPALVRAIMHVESRGKPFAESPVGAIGLMQVMPANAKACDLQHYSQLWQPETNIRCGVWILTEELKATGGDLARALYRYNGGPKCDFARCKGVADYARNVLAKMARDIR